jgi:HD superfamily phosphohydrolase
MYNGQILVIGAQCITIGENEPMLTLRPGYVSDPVHGFIPFTGLERRITDHMVAQRLRRISQTGLSNYIYPELVSSRFGHCLGAMHLASAFLAAAFRNSTPETLETLVSGITWAVRQAHPEYNPRFPRGDIQIPALDGLAEESNSNQTLQVYRLYNPPPSLEPAEVEQRRRALIIAERALRLASLFHDLGHLPFSHNFEDALQEMHDDNTLPEPLRGKIQTIELGRTDAEGRKEKLHETIGFEIGHLTYRSFLAQQEQGGSESKFEDTLYGFVHDLWKAAAPWEYARTHPGSVNEVTAARNWLKSLISGQIDVDRADYILRDGRNYGFDFASFNLERLLGQLVVFKESDGSLVLATKPQGVGFLESFILARYRSYQYGVLHHKASQVGTALQTVIRDSLLAAFAPIGNEFNLSTEVPTDASGMARMAVDDPTEEEQPSGSFFETMRLTHLQQLARFIDDIVWLLDYKKRRESGAIRTRPLEGYEANIADRSQHYTAESEYAVLRRFAEYDDYWFTNTLRQLDPFMPDEWAQLVWWRKPVARSLWKRPHDFTLLLERAKQDDAAIPNNLRDWNDQLNEFVRISESENHLRWGEALTDLRSTHRVLASYRQIAPLDVTRKGDEEVSEGLYVESGGQLHPLTKISPLASALADAWKGDLHLRAFVLYPVEKSEPRPLDDHELEELGVTVIKKLWAVLKPKDELSAQTSDK